MGANHPVAAGLKVLGDILKIEKKRGLETVPLNPDTARNLQSLPSQFLKAAQQSLAAEPKPAPPQESASAEAQSVSPLSEPQDLTGDSSALFPALSERSEKAIRARLNEIFKAVKNSQECRELGTLFQTIVFASGNPLADIMFVGEAPGAEEERQKKPFVGPSGQKLEQMLKAMGLSREDIYISNIVKFRPKKADGRLQGNSNRAPTADEMRVSLPYIRAEIEAVRPKAIVALGKTAAEGLLDRGGSIKSFRAQENFFSGIPVIVSYHPSYVLRQEREQSPEGLKPLKRGIWEDMLKAMDFAGLPVSEKQRGYFL